MMKILLVEDDKDIAQFIKKGLIKNSFAVECAFDGEEGLRTAPLSQYHLIILDLMLPKMNGVEVLKRMRGMDVQTPVIFLTAKDTLRDIVQG